MLGGVDPAQSCVKELVWFLGKPWRKLHSRRTSMIPLISHLRSVFLVSDVLVSQFGCGIYYMLE